MKFIIHCFLILIAYAAATYAATIAINVASMFANSPFTLAAFTLSVIGNIVSTSVFFWLFLIVWAAALPFFLAIFIAEIANIRSLVAWLLFGAALGLLATFLGESYMPWLRATGGLYVSVAAGIVAGLVYWLIAGRSSGTWKA